MAEPEPVRFDPEVVALSFDLGERFDAVKWNQFNDRDLGRRNATRKAVLAIREDLMKVAETEPKLAAIVWDNHVPAYVPRPLELPESEKEPPMVNSIEPGRRRRKETAQPFLDPSLVAAPDIERFAGRRALNEEPEAVKPDAKADRSNPREALAAGIEDPRADRVRMLLEGLERQYLKADEKYHFRDRGREVAFEAQDKKLVTQHDAPMVVGSMIDLAEAKGWSSLKLNGTNDFKREAWLQASLRDFEVSGFRPSAVDKARLEELKAERRGQGAPERPNTMADASQDGAGPGKSRGFQALAATEAHEPPLALTKPQDQAVGAMEVMMRSRGDSPRAISMARAELTDRLRSDRVYVGKLVEVGTAAYQDRPGEKPSHFVTLEDDNGRRNKVWGVDLPRALAQSGAVTGEKVAVAFKGRQTVTVDEPVKDLAGKTVAFEKKEVDRNTWEIVGFDRLRDTAKTRVEQAANRANQPADLRVYDRRAPALTPEPKIAVDRPRARERAR